MKVTSEGHHETKFLVVTLICLLKLMLMQLPGGVFLPLDSFIIDLVVICSTGEQVFILGHFLFLNVSFSFGEKQDLSL